MLDHLNSNDQLKSRFQLTTTATNSGTGKVLGFVVRLTEAVKWGGI